MPLCRDVKCSVSEFFPVFSSSSHHAKPGVNGLSVPLHFLSTLLGASEDVKEPQVFLGFWRKLVFTISSLKMCNCLLRASLNQ